MACRRVCRACWRPLLPLAPRRRWWRARRSGSRCFWPTGSEPIARPVAAVSHNSLRPTLARERVRGPPCRDQRAVQMLCDSKRVSVIPGPVFFPREKARALALSPAAGHTAYVAASWRILTRAHTPVQVSAGGPGQRREVSSRKQMRQSSPGRATGCGAAGRSRPGSAAAGCGAKALPALRCSASRGAHQVRARSRARAAQTGGYLFVRPAAGPGGSCRARAGTPAPEGMPAPARSPAKGNRPAAAAGTHTRRRPC
jgi:hypothetical protein